MKTTLLSVLIFISNFLFAINVPVSGRDSVRVCAGTVYDPGGPFNYPSSCSGQLTIFPATPGHVIQIVFKTISINVDYDKFAVYDAVDYNGGQVKHYQSRHNVGKGNVITATNSEGAITIYFYSDGQFNDFGFEAQISCVPRCPDCFFVGPNSSMNLRTCEGTISSYFREGNPINLDGTTTIYSSSSDRKVSLDFTTFNTNPLYDYLEVYDGENKIDSLLIGNFKGDTLPSRITATGPTGSLTLHFVSGSTSVSPGFSAKISCEIITSLQEMEDPGKSIIIYPNPVNNYFTIFNQKINFPIVSVSLHNATDALLNTFNYSGKNEEININVSELPKGFYTVKVKTTDNIMVSKILVKN